MNTYLTKRAAKNFGLSAEAYELLNTRMMYQAWQKAYREQCAANNDAALEEIGYVVAWEAMCEHFDGKKEEQ